MKYIIDLDGTLLDKESINLDAHDFIQTLQREDREFIIMTNSVKSPAMIVDRLKKHQLIIDESRIMNPITAINIYNEKMGYKSAYIIGSQREIKQVNIPYAVHSPDVVILLDFEKDNKAYEDLQRVFEHASCGVPIIAASRSPYYRSSKGNRLDTGAFVHLIEHAADVNIEIIGKPSRTYFMSGLSQLSAEAEEVVVIGDDWSTDIKGGNEIGCQTALIRSGKYQNGDEIKGEPTWCINGLMEILK